MSIPVLSFFTGAGFLDMGFELEGFDSVWVNEHNPSFLALYLDAHASWMKKRRKPQTNVYVETRSVEDLRLNKILSQAFSDEIPELFGIVGGPPCPDFSAAGLHEGHKGVNGKLTKTYVELICGLQPSFFVLENVAGLARFEKHSAFLRRMVNKLSKAGYLIEQRILNALELGVPQFRERLFVIGFKEELVQPYLQKAGLSQNEEGWFPWPEGKYKNAMHEYNWPATNEFGTKTLKPRDVPLELCVASCLIPKSKRDSVPNANNMFKAYSDKFFSVREGDTTQKSFKRLHRYRFSPTACYGNNEVHLHPWEPRRISLREAMRIQGVPDSYAFPEDVSLTPSFKMVSNGVPVPMAREVAKSVKLVLRSI